MQFWYASKLKVLPALFLLFMAATVAVGQNEVAIGSTTTKSNAVLWLNGNGKQGLILPVVTNRNAVEAPDKGMIVFDDSDGKVYFRSSDLWIEVGSGGGGTSSLRLQQDGNNIRLFAGANELSAIPLAGGTATNGSLMVFESGAWKFANLSGDVSGTFNALQVGGIKGKTVASLPATAQALVYDPAANSGSGGWTFQSLGSGSGSVPTLGSGQILVGNGTSNSAVTLGGDATLSGANLSLNPISGGVGGKITDNTITNADIATSAGIAVNKLESGTNGQVLTTSGGIPTWSNAATGTVTSVTAGTGLTGGTITGTGTIGVDVGTTANKIVQLDANAKLPGVDGSALTNLNAGNITTGTLPLTRIAQSAAKSGQVIKWDGSAWTAADDQIGTGTVPTLGTGQILVGDGLVNTPATLSGDGTLLGGILTLSPITSLKIDDNTITNADISTSAGIAVTKLASGANGQVLTTSGGVPTWSNAASGTVTSVTAGTGLTGGTITGTGTIGVDVGTTANKVVQLDANAKLPGVDGSALTNLNAGSIASGTLALGRITPGANGQILTTSGGVPTWSNAASGTVTSVTAGTGLTGGTITGTGTIGVDVGTTANKVVQLDANAKLPGVDGSALTNLNAGNITSGALSLNRLAQGGATSGQVLKWDGTYWTAGPDNEGGKIILKSGEIVVGDGTTNTAATLTGDATLSGATLTLKPISGGTAGTIADNTITDADISASALINVGKLSRGQNGQVLTTNGTDVVWSQAASGTVTSVTAGNGLLGGIITGTGTIWVDAGTTANKIVQLDANAKLPGVDGSALTNLNAGSIATGTLALGRITPGANGQILTTSGGVPTWSNAASGTVTSVTAGTGLTGGTITGTGTIGVDVGTTANKVVQLDANAKLPGVDGSALTNLNAGNITSGALSLNRLAQGGATSGQVLKWDGTYWTAGPDNEGGKIILKSGEIVVGDGTTNTAATLTGDATLSGATLTLKPISGGTAGTIADNTITDADISAGALINVGKLSRGQNGQVLTTNGTDVVWSQAASGTVTSVTAGTGLTGGTITGTGTIGVDVGTTANKIVQLDAAGKLPVLDGSALKGLNASAIDNGSLALARLAQGTANTGEFLRWDGSGWKPTSLGDVVPALSQGEIIIGNGTFNKAALLSGDVTLSDSTITLKPITGGTGGKIADGTITNDDISISAGIAGTKVNASFGSQDISTTGKASSSSLSVGSTGQFQVSNSGNITKINGLSISFPATQGLANSVLTNDGTGSLVWARSGGWTLSGNTGTDETINFIGTSDAQSLRFKVNNQPSGYLSKNGNSVAFGFYTPQNENVVDGVAIGKSALTKSVGGMRNIAIGSSALANAETSSHNTGIGGLALYQTTAGEQNTALGSQAGFDISTGSQNTAIGAWSMYQGTANTGSLNTAVGFQSMATNFADLSGSRNTVIGAFSDIGPDVSNSTAIGFNARAMVDNAVVLGTIGAKVGIGTSSPTANLEVRGTLKLASGDQGQGKVLTSDAEGNATWQVPASNGIASSNGPTFFGYEAGASNLSISNTGFGFQALISNTSGEANAAFGRYSLSNNTTGVANTAFGNSTMSNVTTASYNTGVGASALQFNTGNFNTGIGSGALTQNTAAEHNTALGYNALNSVKTGSNNTSVGSYSLSNSTSSSNTAVGFAAQSGNTTGNNNVSVGNNALYQNTTGNYNTSIGSLSMYGADGGSYNTAIGYASLPSNSAAGSTTAVGVSTFSSLQNGTENTAVGDNAGRALVNGLKNTVVGASAMFNGTGNYNTVIGANADVAQNSTNATAIGYGAFAGVNNSVVLGGTGPDAVNVGIGTSLPSASLEVDGYTKLGGNSAPAIKIAKLTGTTSATEGGQTTISLGSIPASKILSIDVMVEYANGSYMPPRYNGAGSTYEYSWYSNTVAIVILLDPAAINMKSKPVKVLVTYEN